LLFGTTAEFLERLGLASIGDLPSLAPLLKEPDQEHTSGPVEERPIEPESDDGA
jgi:chromosome segregation and condensation protein ScpB